MKIVEPTVYFLAATQLKDGFNQFLADNNIDWKPDEGISDAEALIELGGRNCYKSYSQNGVFENNNITRVREGNDIYIKNILESGHGSVAEHATATFMINCSRVVTHELVRHRVGTAYSQVSGRYVRTDDIELYIPEIISENDEANQIFIETCEYLEKQSKRLESIYNINEMKDFGKKKLLTSAFRRILPNGLMNDIQVTANHRAWRHMIELRTTVHAEIEIRIVFDLIAKILKEEFPNIYQDMTCNDKGEWVFENHKI